MFFTGEVVYLLNISVVLLFKKKFPNIFWLITLIVCILYIFICVFAFILFELVLLGFFLSLSLHLSS